MAASRRLAALVAVATALALGACGAPIAGTTASALDARAAVAPGVVDEATIARVLGRVTYGARPADVARVHAIGLDRYLEAQLSPDAIDDATTDAALAAIPSLAMSIPALLAGYPRPDGASIAKVQRGEMTKAEFDERYPLARRPFRIVAELQAAKLFRAATSARQLQEVMTDFWFNHFNVNADKGAVRWYVGAYERDAIRPHALGKFRDLVGATARHPAMLFYLDQWVSTRPEFVMPVGPRRGMRLGLNENYARELMELHTLGVDGGYTQADVRDVARAFTGWTIDRPHVEGRFVFRPAVHDAGEKTILGHRLPAGGGEDDGLRVIDILTRHPATARFIATKLVRRFVSDSPPPALVARVAETYLATDGDIRAMLRTIFAAPEFTAAAARQAKIKTPLEFVASAARVLDARIDPRGGFFLARAASVIGERLYEAEPPTGYGDGAEQWVSPGALLARMNFALALVGNRVDGVRVDVASLVTGADSADPDAVVDRVAGALVPGHLAPATRRALAAELGERGGARRPTDGRPDPTGAVERLAALVIGSPDFQRR